MAQARGGAGDYGDLVSLGHFGSNPGGLSAYCYVPAGLRRGAPLVVALHGCTQTAADYDRGAGWSQLADAEGFAVLLPEQSRANNANLCFNWFAPDDIRRGAGEVESLRQMVAAMVAAHHLDAAQVFVTGLSAGGAMAAAMLATHPECFAGGAIIAGLPFASADGVPQAFERMRGQGLPDAASLAARIRAASSHQGRWPLLSVWQGSADATVDAANAEVIAAAWALLHGARPTPALPIGRHGHRVWRDAAGRSVVELTTITGMAHGTPLATTGPEACGAAGPFMLDVGVSSTRRIAAFWRIAPAVEGAAAPKVPPRAAAVPPAATSIEAIIGRALRQAGLLA